MNKSKAYIEEHKNRFLQELIELLKIPSISADSAYKDDVLKSDENIKSFSQKEGIFISAKTGNGLSKLLNEIEKRLYKNEIIKTIEVPFENGKLINWIYENSNILKSNSKSNLNILKIRISRSNINRLKSRWPNLNF